MQRRTTFMGAAMIVAAAMSSVEARHGHHSYYGTSYVGNTYVGAPIVSGTWYPMVPIVATPWAYGVAWYPPPLTIPADALYGPGQVLRLMGLGTQATTTPATNVLVAPPQQPVAPVVPGGAQAGAGQAPQPQPMVRASNRPSRDRAQQWIAIGDNYFGKQRYNEAYQRYRDAAIMASDLADVFFREGFALAAMGRWESAVTAMRRGLQLDSAWPRSNFRIDALYAGNKLAKIAHGESLARAAATDPRDPDLLFLIAVHLYCDGQHERSKVFFERARELDPAHAQHVQPFLEALARAQAPRQL